MPDSPTPAKPSDFQKSDHLWNRTFVGLLIAQFLAAFNDQAIHASAMFFAINKKALTQESAISLMPILFFAPWAIFPTIAGYCADKFSKRHSLVIWKFVEVGITGIALTGFIVGSELNMPNLGVWIVLSTVFLMGMHSTFFVPAKYGAMPEILKDELLSKGNGVLESLSFLAVILGTVSGGVLSHYFNDDEYVIGIVLTVLAIIGAAASLLIRRMPAASPNRPLPKYVFQPLWVSLKSLVKSRPLVFALVGIAFFTFMLAFMRQAVYMFGESRVPRWNELKTSVVVGMTALGIGVGSPLAGYLSGKKVELGLIPIGGFGMILGVCLAAAFLHHTLALVICIVLIGLFTGFYLVPMFTQLQHRAPKDQKGEVVATSNFTNVIGAILASLLFFLLVKAAHTFGFAPPIAQTEYGDVWTLADLQVDKHHHPVFFRIRPAEGKSEKIGKPVNKDEAPVIPNLADDDGEIPNLEILVTQKAMIEWNKYQDAKEQNRELPHPKVRVSKYVLTDRGREIPHYYVRQADEAQHKRFDNRELPKYLFYGAGFMTLGVLLFLGYLLPDLITRARWVVRSLGKERMRVAGVNNIPGHGGVLLANDAALPETRRAVCWGSDRQVMFISKTATEKDLQDAEHRLKKGEVVAVDIHLPGSASEHHYHRLSIVSGVSIIPVHAKPSEVRFGKVQKDRPTADQLRLEIEAIRVADMF